VLLKQASESLPLPRSYIPDLPSDVEAVLLKTLAKEPYDRYHGMQTLIEELQNLLVGKEVTAATIGTETLRMQMTGTLPIEAKQPTKKSKKWVRPLVVVAVLGVIGVIAAGGGYWYLSSNPGMLQVAPSLTQEQEVVVAVQTATLPPETALPPTEPVEVTPEETAPPTEPPIAAEIRDNKNVSMMLVPAGECTMGTDDSGDASTKPAHTIYLEDFYIDKYEVTNELYDACVYEVECRKPRQSGSVTRSTYFNNPVFANYPVLYVDWKMASAYCEWRGARFPTEAEWEKAARGTDQRSYPWGSDKLDCLLANFAGCVEDTTPVDQHEGGVSPYGAYGMAGKIKANLASASPGEARGTRLETVAMCARIHALKSILAITART